MYSVIKTKTMINEKKKKIPCEECRDQKRKCNGETPCERCEKFNLSCIYTSSLSPRDEEYLDLARQAALLQQIEILNHQMKNIEAEIQQVKSSNSVIIAPPSNTTPLLIDDNSLFSFEENNSITCFDSVYSSENPTLSCSRHIKRTKLIASMGDNINAYLTTNKKGQVNASKIKPWTLTFKKGTMSVHTQVTTHSDLLDNLFHMMATVELMTSIPPMFKNTFQHDTIVGILNSMIRNKYGKTHYNSVAKSVRIFITPDLSSVDTILVAQSPDSIQVTTNRLLRAYLRCQHLQQLAIHAHTFIRLFIDNDTTLENSPAAMALCAAICTFRCKHVTDCLPSISLVEYGKFYFDRARDLLSDLFDQFDLESFTSYTFMTIYKLTMAKTEEALLYADMAERIALVLDPHYTALLKQAEEKGEAVHFKRLRNHLHRALKFEQISRTDPNLLKKFNAKDLPFCTLLQMGEGTWEIAQDDSTQEKWFAEMHGYILLLQRAGHEASKHAQSCDLYHLIDLVGHQVEMSMRHWYHKVLPTEFKLTLPLFDSTTVGSKEFYTTLERECAHSSIPALTTLALYEEWLVLSQAYLPKSMPSPEDDWQRLNEVWSGGPTCLENQNHKWTRRIEKLVEMRQVIEFEGTDAEYVAAVNSMMGPLQTRINRHVILLALHASFNTIRLIKYLRSRSQDCHFDIKNLINAWQILLTVSKLQEVMPPEVLEYIPRVHKNLVACMTIVKEELRLQPYQGKVGDYVNVMENDLESQVIEKDDSYCVA